MVGSWMGWVLVIMGIGLSVSCLILFLDDATLNHLVELIFAYQALIAGCMAVLAAVITGAFMVHLHNRKIGDEEKAFLYHIMNLCVDMRLLCKLIIDRQPLEQEANKMLQEIYAMRPLLQSGRMWQIDKKAGKISKTLFRELSKEGLTVQDIRDNVGYIRQRCTDLYARLETLVR